MKIMVDISEKDWKFMQKTYKETGLSFVPEAIKNECVKAVYNGTPLPKGHGRLIDADKLQSRTRLYAPRESEGLLMRYADLQEAPTIIEADKED